MLHQQQQQPFSNGLLESSTFSQKKKPADFIFDIPQQQTVPFGQQQEQQPSMSGSFSTPTFGQQQPSTSDFFGTITFAQQNKATEFGFHTPQPQACGLFDQHQTRAQPKGSSLFDPAVSGSKIRPSDIFGTPRTGTTIRFTPTTGIDKNQVTELVRTAHHCITCMKEYEGKSLEELRYEDYSVNRKGPPIYHFGGPVPSNTPLFRQTDNKPTLGQSAGFRLDQSTFGQNKPTLGQAAGFGLPQSPFGQPNTGYIGLQNQLSTGNILFGKPATGFGIPVSSTKAFGFGTNTSVATSAQYPILCSGTTQPLPSSNTTQQTSRFGTYLSGKTSTENISGTLFKSTQPTTGSSAGQPIGFKPKPFGGTTQQTSGFGTDLFGHTSTQNNTRTLFGQSTQPTIGFGTGQSMVFTVPQTSTATASLQTGQTQFGQSSTAFAGLQSQQNSTNILFGAPVSSTSTFGIGTNTSVVTSTGTSQQPKPFSETPQDVFGQTSTQNNTRTLFDQSTLPTTGLGTGQSMVFGLPQTSTATSSLQTGQAQFGQPTTAFAGLQSQQNGTNVLFSAPVSSTSTFGIGTNTSVATSIGTSQQPKPFGGTLQTACFRTDVFGQTSTQNNTRTLFGQSTQPTIGFGTGQSMVFAVPQTSTATASLQTGQAQFGQPTTAFAGLQSQQNGTNVFFGAPVNSTSTSGIGTNTSAATSIGTSQQPKPFGETPQTAGFRTDVFGQTSTQNNTRTLFDQSTLPTTGLGTGQSMVFGLPQTSTATSSLQTGQAQFGQPTTAFSGLQSQLNGTNVFFGAPVNSTSTSGIGTNTSAATPIGTSQQPKLFGGTSQPLFRSNSTQQTSGFGTELFGQTSTQNNTGTLFGKSTQPTTGFVSGQTTSSIPTGQTLSPFGQLTSAVTGLQSQQNASNIFFGRPVSSTSSFGVGSNMSVVTPKSIPQQLKPFAGATQSLFSSNTAQQTSGFGTELFGQTSNQNNTGTLFGKSSQPTTGFGTQQSTVFGVPLAGTASSLFEAPKLLGQTTNTCFNQTNIFGQQLSTISSSTVGKPLGSTFTPVATQSFGTSSNNTLHTGLSFANKELFTGPSNSTFSATDFQQRPQQPLKSPTTEENSTAILANLSSSPFPVSPHLASLAPSRTSDRSGYVTKQAELNSNLDSLVKETTPTLKLKPIKSVKASSIFGSAGKEGNELYENYMMKNQKQLFIKNATENDESIFSDPDEDLIEAIKKVEEPTATDVTENSIGLHDDTAPIRTETPTTPQGNNFEVIENEQTMTATEFKSDSIENGESEKENEPQKKIHPCGVILTRPEYYTVPPLQDIEKYENEDGTCIIKGFTIGRMGYGNVHFPDSMDVAGLNLDALVFIRQKEVTVYPDDSKKPPVGQGLNRRAQITLDHIDLRGNGSYTDSSFDKIVDRLKEVSTKQDSKFLEYRPETDSWVFEVEHFTTYGLRENEEPMTIPMAVPTNQDKDKIRDEEKYTVIAVDGFGIDISKQKMIQLSMEESYEKATTLGLH